jgi:GNAT superfamily N-acetyltransferase
MITIRIAQPIDAPEIARLNFYFNGVETPAEEYAARLEDPRRVDNPILAELDGRVFGLANLRLAPSVFYAEPYAELSELFVEKNFRRQGAGQALVRLCGTPGSGSRRGRVNHHDRFLQLSSPDVVFSPWIPGTRPRTQ